MIKWVGTILCLCGIFLTSFNIYPLNIVLSIIGSTLWTIAGIIQRDVPLFLVEAVAVAFYLAGMINYLKWRGNFKKNVLAVLLLTSSISLSAQSVTSWENSPYNWKNSEYNYENSSANWNNSQYNWKNSEFNYNSNTGVYDNSGNRVGYETITPSGTRNYYDNNGNRRAYSK